jgi:hypothetical protein
MQNETPVDVRFGSFADISGRSGDVRYASHSDTKSDTGDVRFVPILLQKSVEDSREQ